MSRTNAILTSATAIILFLAGASIALAQPPTPAAERRIEVSAGYQVLHIPDETFPFGLNFDVSTRVRPSLDVTGEFGFARDEQTEPGVSGTLTFLNFGAGPRWRKDMGAYIPFVQLIAGGVRPSADRIVNGVTLQDTDWAFMLQPGAGIVVPLVNNVGVVGQLDYRRAFFAETGENEFRFIVGVRLAMRR